jgi:glucuronoarabinoxylan endo-1,4-beta-xylanase
MKPRPRLSSALRTCRAALAVLSFTHAAVAATVHVDRSTKYQTIDGFGFFGARDAWWGAPGTLVDPAWARLVIDDLGLTLWRNEYYPSGDADGAQDADWSKQKPVALALRDQAAASGVPLQTILTVWSPPARMKCESDRDAIHDGKRHPGGTKGGGAVCPSQRSEFAEWLIAGLKLYADIGIQVYALSFQNEPLFRQGFNSGVYPRAAYADTLAVVGARIHAAYPKVKLFGPENMLDIECGRNDVEFDPWWYTGNILAKPKALAELGAWAVHGYSDGVLATPTSKVARLWTNYYSGVSHTRRPIWMTETSGYVDSWEGGINAKGERRPGAFDLAQAIFAALYYGKVSGWVWWQGSSSDAANEFSLMQGSRVGRRYFAAKQFYRFIRPGARMVATTSDDPELLAAAFEHDRIGNFVTVLINVGESQKSVVLDGPHVPDTLDAHVTTATQIVGSTGTPVRRDAITLPARSVTTLVSGGYLDEPRRHSPRGEKPDRKADPSPASGASRAP